MPRTIKPSKRQKIERSEPEDAEDIESALEDIYQDSDGTIPDMHHIERRKSRTGMMMTFLALVFLAAAAGAAWLGFFIFNPADKFSEELVTISVGEPAKIVSGLEAEYEVRVHNGNKIALSSADIELKLPDNFIVTGADPKGTTPKNDSWIIGALAGDATKVIHFTGAFAAPKDSHDSIRALLTYRPANFNSEFQKIVNEEIAVAADSFTISVNHKPAGDKEQFTIAYKNLSSEVITDLRVITQLGPNFTATKTTPTDCKTQSGTTTCNIASVAAGTDGTVTVMGAYKGSETPIAARLERDLAGVVEVLVQSGTPTDIVAAPTAPNSTDPASLTRIDDTANKAVDVKGAVTLRANFTNTTDKPVTLKLLSIVGDTPAIGGKGIFDFTNLQTSGDPEVIGKSAPNSRRLATISWSADKIPGGSTVAPGASVTVEIHISRKAETALNLAAKVMNANFSFSATIDGGAAVNSDPLSIPLVASPSAGVATSTTP